MNIRAYIWDMNNAQNKATMTIADQIAAAQANVKAYTRQMTAYLERRNAATDPAKKEEFNALAKKYCFGANEELANLRTLKAIAAKA